jgi:hypothetical protein
MIILAALLACAQQPQVQDLSLDPVPHHLGVAALGPGGAPCLVSVTGRLLRLVDEPGFRIQLQGESVLWTIADLDGDGGEEVVVLLEGRELRRIVRGAERLEYGAPILSEVGALPPRGLLASSFVRDVNGDGRNDLVLPLGVRVRILLGTPEGFRPGPNLGAIARLALEAGGGENLLDRVEREYSIPALDPEDSTGDGLADLVVGEGMLLHQFVATAAGLPEQPTRTLDMDPFRMDPDELDIDLGNLSRLVRTFVVEEWADLDGDGAQDLIVLGDGKIRVYPGSRGGIDPAKPGKTMKVDGNPFYVAAARMDEDAHPDLVVVRIEDIGIGKLLRAALFSWSIKFDFLVYRGTGTGSFASRPLYDRTVVVKGGSILAMARNERDRLGDLRQRIVRRGDLDGDGRATDILVLEPQGLLRVWRDAAPAGSAAALARERFLQETLGGSGKEVSFDIEELGEWVLGRTSALLSLTGSRPADVELQSGADWEPPHALALRDLDGDGRDEAIVLRRIKEEGGTARLVGIRVDF